jgi:hemerythrin-like domain-containing protein
MSDICEKITIEHNKLQQNLIQLRADMEKLKGQINDKASKSLFTELEGKVNQHTKALDNSQRKIFEFGSKLDKFVEQPISHTLIENIRKQLTEEIMVNIKAVIDPLFANTHKLIEEKNNETRGLINKTKGFFYAKK